LLTEPTPPAGAARSAEELAALAQSGDRRAFDELVVQLRPRLVAFLARRLAEPADAEDIAQEAFLRAFDHLASYEPGRPFATWLFAIGKNTAANHALSRARRVAREARAAQPEPAMEGAPDEGSERAAADELWQRAARVLAPDAYRALHLCYVHGRSIAQVAQELGRSKISVKVMMFRARRRLVQEVR
jgi:RNA polymerase sigma-70 factor (ECF subfamily)